MGKARWRTGGWMAVSALCCRLACAAEPESAVGERRPVAGKDTPVQLAPIHVVERADSPLAVAPGAVEISREEIGSQPHLSVWEQAASHVPGIHFTRRAPLGYGIGPGSGGGVAIRGSASGQRHIVLIDGRPDTMGIFGHTLNDAYFSYNLERIEIVKGPSALRHGNSAMAGSVNLVPYRVSEGQEVRIGAEYGRWNTWRAYGAFGGRHEALDYGLTFFGAASDGHRDNSAAEGRGGAIRLGVALDDAWRLDADVRYSYIDTQDPGTVEEVEFVRSRGESLAKYSQVERSGFDLSLRNRSHERSGFLKAYMNYGDHTIRNGLSAPGMGTTMSNRYWYDSWDRTLGLWAEQTFPLFGRGGRMTAGADVRQYAGDPVITTPEPSIPAWAARDPARREQVEAAAYMIAERSFFAEMLQVGGGLRMQHHDRFGEKYIPAAAVRYLPAEGTVVRVSAARGYRAPTLAEQYVVPVANEDLKAERMTNYEIGWEQRAGEMLRFDLTGFYHDFDNLIAAESLSGDGRPPFQLKNSGAYSAWGMEGMARVRLDDQWTFGAGFAYVDPDDRTAGVPLLQYKADIRFRWRERWSASLNAEIVRDLYASDNKDNRMDNYANVDAMVRVRLSEFDAVYGRVDNLLDESYETVPGKPMPGRALYVGFQKTL